MRFGIITVGGLRWIVVVDSEKELCDAIEHGVILPARIPNVHGDGTWFVNAACTVAYQPEEDE